MTAINKAMTVRKALIAQLKHNITVISTLDTASNPATIRLRKQILTDVYTKLERNWTTILTTPDPKKEFTDTTQCLNENNELEDAYIAAQTRLEDLCPIIHSLSSTAFGFQAPLPPSNVATNVKLPPIKLKPFNGEFDAWEEFKDTFCACFPPEGKVSDCQKMLYLRGLLGEQPLALIKNLKSSNENYNLAWQILEKRYANKRRIMYSHFRNMMEVTPILEENATDLRELIDTATASLIAVRLHFPVIGMLDEFTVFMMAQKLDRESRKHWEEHLKASTTLPSFEQFKTFIEIRFNILDSLGIVQSSSNLAPAKSPPVPHQKGKKPAARTFHSNTRKIKCPVCGEEHKAYECPDIMNKTVTERKQLVSQRSLCTNCFYKHSIEECASKFLCRHCKQKHHTLLHEESVSSQPSTGAEAFVNVAQVHRKTTAFLATAKVQLTARNGETIIVRTLIDPASSVNLISENIAQTLHAARSRADIPIHAVGDHVAGSARHQIQLQLRSIHSTYSLHAVALVIPKITRLPAVSADTDEWKPFENLQLADPQFQQGGRIDLLIGVEVYAEIILSGLVKNSLNTTIAQETELGWIISGGVNKPSKHHCLLTTDYTDQIDDRLKTLWEIEELTNKPSMNVEDKKCEELFSKTTTICPDGRFMVRLPFSISPDTPEFLGESYKIASVRLQSILRKLAKDKDLHKAYQNYVDEYIKAGHIRLATTAEILDTKNCFFMPHHAVVKKESTTTKTRVVFDASCKSTNGYSLNDRLLTGPIIQSDLFTILLRWRKFAIAFTADISKMYLQFRVHPDDAKFQRILWPVDDKIRQFISTTITFGTASAPFQAVRLLHLIAEKYQDVAPLAAELLLNNFYVDDCAGGAKNLEEAIIKYNELSSILQNHGLLLRKWTSNSPELLQNIPTEHQETKAKVEITEKCTIKALGLHWDPARDSFSYTLNLPERGPIATKRSFLSDYSMLFDPLGWLGPCLVLAKIMLQHIWIKGTKWDDPLPKDINGYWQELRVQMQRLHTIEIPRWIGWAENLTHVSLHGFSDASEQAYAAVVYLRTETDQGQVQTAIVAAKTKVAPIKRVSLPRLELCGAYILANLIQKLRPSFPDVEIRAYTDSRITLHWLYEHPSKWNCFIGNRTTLIQESIPASHWFHVKSAENPADCASRGLIPEKLAEHKLWWQGPIFLQQSPDYWPGYEALPLPEDADVEARPKYKPIFIVQPKERPLNALLQHYSWLDRLLRGSGYIIRLCRRNLRSTGKISTSEKELALKMWVRITQAFYFYDEIKSLTNKTTIPNKSKLLSLTPFLDEEGLMRITGRLDNTEQSFDTKHPIILPANDHLTWLIIQNAHIKTLHGGNQLTAHYIRQRFWIIHARRTIRNHLHKCVACYRYKAKAATQLMGHLPSPRVQPSTPFMHTGVDYAGYFEVKTATTRQAPYSKCYIALFVCLCIKAFHLELVEDLTTASFISAFRRFAARRGIAAHLYMDNALYFQGAKNELPKLLLDGQSQQSQEIIDALNNDGTQFHFIPPHSPNFGGLWEAGVKSTKYHLKRILGGTRLRYPEFTTVLTQIESVLNSRPLCPLTSDPNDLQTLTPGHFLIGRPLCAVPNPDVTLIPTNRLKSYQTAQRLVQQFWKIWSSEYLNRLQQRPKWNKEQPNPRIGQIILIKEDNLPPNKWLLGRIINTTSGTDGKIRVVQIKTATTTLNRAISKVCILPIEDNQ